MWICKECGGKVVEVITVPMTIIKSIKNDGRSGKILAQQKHAIAHNRDYSCLNCKNRAPAVYRNALKIIAEWVEDKE
ncbi:MAG: hypothetical protein ACRCZO_09385 [Cetobacterium sp.]